MSAKTTEAKVQSLTTMTPAELMTTLKEYYVAEHPTEKGVPSRRMPRLLVLGEPGIGKTSIVYQVADELKVPRFTFQATLYDPTEIKGLPVFDHEKNQARFLPFEDMPSMPDGFLVIDDLPHAPTSTQNAFMRLILEGCAGAWNLGGLYPVATGNRASDRAGAKDLQTAMGNRFQQTTLCISHPDWRKWAVKHDLYPSIIAWLSSPTGQEWLCKFDAGSPINATPRSWEMASNSSYALKNHATILRTAIMGEVGEEAATKYFGWIKYFERMPDLQKIIKGQNIFPDELDVMYATISGLIALVKDFQKKTGIVQRLIDYAVAMPQHYVELGALLSKDLLNIAGQDAFMNANLEKWADRYPDLIG